MHTKPTTHTTATAPAPANNKGTKFLAISAGLICLALALCSALWLWSSVLTVRPEKLLSQWQQKPAEFDKALATSLLPRLKQSLAFNASDANSYFLLAGLYQLLAEHGGETGDKPNNQQQDYFDLAEANYKKALQQQPTWDYAWAKLASFYNNNNYQVKLTLPVLNQAMLLGPYELETQKILIPLIIEHWAFVSEVPAMSEQAEKILRQSLKFGTNARLVLEAAKQFNKLDELTTLVTTHSHINRLKKYKKEHAKQASIQN
jgi:hypothetical protein